MTVTPLRSLIPLTVPRRWDCAAAIRATSKTSTGKLGNAGKASQHRPSAMLGNQSVVGQSLQRVVTRGVDMGAHLLGRSSGGPRDEQGATMAAGHVVVENSAASCSRAGIRTPLESQLDSVRGHEQAERSSISWSYARRRGRGSDLAVKSPDEVCR